MTPFGEHSADPRVHAYLVQLEARLKARLRADQSAWNRKVAVLSMRYPDGRRRRTRAEARFDGTLALREDVLDQLRDLWTRPGVPRSEQEKRLQQRARSTARHELDHFIHPDGQPFAAGLVTYRRWTTRVLEEGGTECVAQNHADIDAAEMEALSPGMTRVSAETSYQEFAPAVRTLAAYAGGLLGRRPAELVDELGREAIQGKFPRLARLVVDAGGLRQRIPEDERVDCEMHVAQEVRNVFWRNSGWAKPDPEGRLGTIDPAGRSRVMGFQAAAAAERARLEIEQRYGTPSQAGNSWELAAAVNEYRLAREAFDFARRRATPDVRAAARDWRDRAAHQLDAARQWDARASVAVPQRTVNREAPGLGPAERDPRLAAIRRRRPHRARPDLGRAR